MTTAKLVAVLDDRNFARELAGAMSDLVDPPPDALTLFEDGPRWRIEAYYEPAPDAAALRALLADLLQKPIPALEVTDVPDLNWVALSQAALPPVVAGKFVVHGSHDVGRVPRGPNSIRIDAGEAFGTAHHATTYGCLIAIDQLTRARAYRNVLDLGCGSGVLAIAVAKSLPQATILATDNDRRSAEVARENMAVNGVGKRIGVLLADGFAHPRLRRPASFDLVIANILAGPLTKLATGVARLVEPGGNLVLSGLLIAQAAPLIATYRNAGFDLVHHRRSDGWSTLILRRRG